MVEPVGSRPATTPVAQSDAVARVAPVTVAKAATPAGDTVETQATELAAAAAAQAPIDADRVARIKKAIAEGRFPILPATIADRLLALKLAWDPHEQA